jgi:hypothetical protein
VGNFNGGVVGYCYVAVVWGCFNGIECDLGTVWGFGKRKLC